MRIADIPLIYPNSPGRIVAQMVAQAIYPFSPGMIYIYIEQGPTIPKIVVTSTTFTDDPFVMPRDDIFMVATPEDVGYEVGSRAGAHFASLMNESVPDTIVLGEN